MPEPGRLVDEEPVVVVVGGVVVVVGGVVVVVGDVVELVDVVLLLPREFGDTPRELLLAALADCESRVSREDDLPLPVDGLPTLVPAVPDAPPATGAGLVSPIFGRGVYFGVSSTDSPVEPVGSRISRPPTGFAI